MLTGSIWLTAISDTNSGFYFLILALIQLKSHNTKS